MMFFFFFFFRLDWIGGYPFSILRKRGGDERKGEVKKGERDKREEANKNMK